MSQNMIALVGLAILACASAVPHHGQPHHHLDSHDNLEQFTEGVVLDMKGLWDKMKREITGLNEAIAELRTRFPINKPEMKIEGDDFKLMVPLFGFARHEITVTDNIVKRELRIKAVHEEQGQTQRVFSDNWTLPQYVDMGLGGKWVMVNGVVIATYRVTNQGDVIKVTETLATPIAKVENAVEATTSAVDPTGELKPATPPQK